MQRIKVLIVIFLFLFISCAPLYYHPLVPELEEVPSNPYGSFIEIKLRNGYTISGELIAVSNDSVFVYSPVRIEVLDIREIKSAKIIIYRRYPNYAPIIIWGLLGTLSTITHGWWLIISAPAWIFVTVTAIANESSEQNKVVYPNITELAKFSRYPQGLPPDLKKKILEEGKLR